MTIGANSSGCDADTSTCFTGTSLFVDPHYGIWVVLLTNRVHPSRDDDSLQRVNALRARFHHAVLAALVGA